MIRYYIKRTPPLSVTWMHSMNRMMACVIRLRWSSVLCDVMLRSFHAKALHITGSLWRQPAIPHLIPSQKTVAVWYILAEELVEQKVKFLVPLPAMKPLWRHWNDFYIPWHQLIWRDGCTIPLKKQWKKNSVIPWRESLWSLCEFDKFIGYSKVMKQSFPRRVWICTFKYSLIHQWNIPYS